MDSVFEPSSQHVDVNKKIVAALERLSQGFRVLLQEAAHRQSLSPIQARFLVHLLHHSDDELGRVGRLAEEFGLSRATVSEAVGTLEAKGLVRREPWPHDGRVATLMLTAEGKEVAAGLSGWADVVEEQLESFAIGEKEEVMRFLMRLISALQGAGVITVARMCVSCRFFRPDAHPRSDLPHHCALLDLPLSGAALRTDCPEHEPAA
jgi:DNA-binding MarR family transcriptional regulator